MSVTTSWYEEQHIVISTFSEEVFLEDVRTVLFDILRHLDEVVERNPEQSYYRMHMIINTGATQKFHFNIIQLVGYLKNLEFERNPRQIGFVMMVNQPEGFGKITKLFTSVALNLFKVRFRYVTTCEEAVNVLKKLDDEFMMVLE